jgi:hypothetical protein
MFLSVRRRDKVWIAVNLTHVSYFFPEAPIPGDYAVVVLTTGEQIKLSHSFSEFAEMVEARSAQVRQADTPPVGSGAIRSLRPRPAGPGSGVVR